VSRGDESGTHQKEREIWQAAAVEPKGPWYLKAGAGMAQALRMAGEKQAYTLSDRATFLALKQEMGLKVLAEGDPLLKNRYAVIVVNPQKHAHVRHEAARRFSEFLQSEEAQQKIAEFGTEQYGEPLFFPDAGVSQ
jgi:tungstate transport system substrate-binding protein